MIRRYRKNEEEESNYWLSIGDLMAGALIIFILLFVLQILNVNKKLAEKEELLGNLGDLEDKVKRLTEKGNRLENIVGMKQTIVSIIIGKFKKENLKIDIDAKTGNIKLDDSILFSFGSAELKPEGKEFLKEFVPKYVEVFFGDNNVRPYITQIVIEGHTDNVGSYLSNLDLSQRRALSVVKFIFGEEMPYFKWKEDLKQIITANGRSNILLIKDKNGNLNAAKSRRVEFQFKLDDEKANEEIKKILSNGVR
ncbi:OmpA/MotB family protein [Candidatus Cetobacterium colombiensis]|uniref:OmpA family protein n=1 Tax=Candidatus Cetobacterium colombiensis TaxID=3073100 RepID=A0ABU4W851_9FUSO|nr:OmpA family protein [Candidatus Cetobacterium colombiensis]MDX8335212.1 OmpA family protein [Candidatus Cetobacterium colombiensis]